MASDLSHLLASPPTDPQERQKLHNQARALALALETPHDAMHRVFWSAGQLPITQVGVDLGLFQTLSSDRTKTFTIEELSQTANAEPALVHRIARYLASFALLEEDPHGKGYRANDTSIWLATPGGEGGVVHFLKTITPIFQAIPDVLREGKYQNPRDPLQTAFQKAHNTKVHGYSWIPDDPTRLTAFFTFLQSQRKGQTHWTEIIPPTELALSPTDLTSNRALMVDVGGGTGPQSLLFRSAGAQGRIVLQDQPSVLAKANTADLSSASIEVMPHDFFTAQPIHNAKFYYLKNIVHDWPDEQCLQILKQVVAVLAEDSLVLIQDCVLPDIGASWKQTQMDMQMMGAAAAVERSLSQWETLMARAGLRIREIRPVNKETGNSVVIAVKADGRSA